MSPFSRPGPRRGTTEQQRPASHDQASRSCPSHTSGRPPTGPVEALREEVAQLRIAMERRPVIDMARGILMARCSCTEDDAWELLVDVSQHSNTKLHDIAEAVLATVHGGPLPAPLQDHLAAAVTRLRTR
ncbi:ANTAR domain-containing protein [Streptomyces sp. BH-SS-21]|uniref:ANTAR domain-containing protein n=1 Tax=Streptomyces liliiviolaceus TaxID=2823109 RepID=A0A940Y4N1_9ACTN|nr:ANTAR domain-containing protein [Streptomyces liliiviolaceus]MBQ0855518.1 ANTAR domain-containing protein [Streptomyces liliiviolaceus]